MTEGAKQIFWLNDIQLRSFGWTGTLSNICSAQKEFSSQAFTIMMWYRSSDLTGHNAMFTIRTGTSGILNGFSVIVEKNSVQACQQNVAMIATTGKIEKDVWTHIAFTRDKTGTHIKGYVNGELVSDGTYIAQKGLPDTIVLPHNVECNAELAKVTLHDIELSQEEICMDMQNINLLQYIDWLRAAYLTGINDEVLVDWCGNYNINASGTLVNKGKFIL